MEEVKERSVKSLIVVNQFVVCVLLGGGVWVSQFVKIRLEEFPFIPICSERVCFCDLEVLGTIGNYSK